MKFIEFYLQENHENVFTEYGGYDIYLNPTSEEIRSLKRNVNEGIKIGVVDIDEIYYWDSEKLIHSDVQEGVVKKDFILYLAWDKDINTIIDETGEAYDGEFSKIYFDKIIPKIEDLFGFNTKFEVSRKGKIQ